MEETNILVVDDEKNIAYAIAQILEEQKWQVTMAYDGQEGLELGLEQGRQEGLEPGLEQGRQEGLAAGERQALIKIVRSLQAKHLPAETIAQMTDLTVADVKQLLNATL